MRADVAQAGGEGTGPGASLSFSTGPQEMVFLTGARDRLLVVGPEAISVHSLPPYEGWESLEGRLFENLNRLADVLPPETKFSETSVRYINQVEIAESEVDLGKYMTISFQLPPSFPQQLTGFLDRVEVVYPDAPAKLAFTWASTQSTDTHSRFILDLDLTASPDQALNFVEARAALNDLKAKETEAFEGLIRDRLREQFGEID